VDETKILIVEDEPLFRELLSHALSEASGMEVIAQTGDASTAVRLATEMEIDVVIMDIELGGDMNGIDAALQIKGSRPGTGIVILSVHNDRRYVTTLPLESTPGWAYLLKDRLPDLATLIRAIEGSKAGMVVLAPEIVASLYPRKGSLMEALTPRQRDVLGLLAQGYSNAAIAHRLTLSEKSVETYINAIYQALHLSSEPEIHARVKATLLFLEDSQVN